jgi:hypothetical protein
MMEVEGLILTGVFLQRNINRIQDLLISVIFSNRELGHANMVGTNSSTVFTSITNYSGIAIDYLIIKE